LYKKSKSQQQNIQLKRDINLADGRITPSELSDLKQLHRQLDIEKGQA
jgi:hypothetical protein